MDANIPNSSIPVSYYYCGRNQVRSILTRQDISTDVSAGPRTEPHSCTRVRERIVRIFRLISADPGQSHRWQREIDPHAFRTTIDLVNRGDAHMLIRFDLVTSLAYPKNTCGKETCRISRVIR